MMENYIHYSSPVKFWREVLSAPIINDKLDVRPSHLHGNGVFATKPLLGHEIVLSYPGTVSDQPLDNDYNIQWFRSVLVVNKPWAPAHYINSSFHTSPNCTFVPTRTKEGDPVIAVVTLRPISIGSELLIDYMGDVEQKGKKRLASEVKTLFTPPDSKGEGENYWNIDGKFSLEWKTGADFGEEAWAFHSNIEPKDWHYFYTKQSGKPVSWFLVGKKLKSKRKGRSRSPKREKRTRSRSRSPLF